MNEEKQIITSGTCQRCGGPLIYESEVFVDRLLSCTNNLCQGCVNEHEEFMENNSKIPEPHISLLVAIFGTTMFFLGAFFVLSTATYTFTSSNTNYIEEFGYGYNALLYFGTIAAMLSVLTFLVAIIILGISLRNTKKA